MTNPHTPTCQCHSCLGTAGLERQAQTRRDAAQLADEAFTRPAGHATGGPDATSGMGVGADVHAQCRADLIAARGIALRLKSVEIVSLEAEVVARVDEIEQLQADLAEARAEIERLKGGWTAEQAKRQVADFNEVCGYLSRIADTLGCANPQILTVVSALKVDLERTRALLEHPVVKWAIEQSDKGRKLVALISPQEAHAGSRYAGYYCEDGPEPAATPDATEKP